MTKLTDKTYTPNSIRTFTGKTFDLKIMDPESICIEDIAHGLAQRPRFAGQLKEFYSVAQHSIWVGTKLPREHKLAALLHDASEAYLGDMPSPFKKLMPDFKHYEDQLMQVIAKKFHFKYPLDPIIKKADAELLQMEWDYFINDSGALVPFDEYDVENMFLEAFHFVKNG